MFSNLEAYLDELRKELNGCDKALIQDALSDAEEYLTTCIEVMKKENTAISDREAFQKAVEDFGEPKEIAADYRKFDNFLTPTGHVSPKKERKSGWDFFMIITDLHAWGAVLYMLISLLTGVVFFTWVVTGLSLSLSLLILIIGIPVAGLYLLSVRGLALIEGRIVEALLGVRMPRRSVFISSNKGLWNKFKELLFSGITWKVQAYMLLQLCFGIIYFTVAVVFLVISLSLIASPFIELFIPQGVHPESDIKPEWLLQLVPLFPFVGILLFFITLHLAKAIGKFQGWFARLMLVHV